MAANDGLSDAPDLSSCVSQELYALETWYRHLYVCFKTCWVQLEQLNDHWMSGTWYKWKSLTYKVCRQVPNIVPRLGIPHYIISKLLQICPWQWQQSWEQNSPAFLHPHILPHPDLHPQDMIWSKLSGATDLSLSIGTSTPPLFCHPHSCGERLFPNHCWTAW